MNLHDTLPRDLVTALAAEEFAGRGAPHTWPEEELRIVASVRAGVPFVPFNVDNVDIAALEKLREVCVRLRCLPTFSYGTLLHLVSPVAFSPTLVRELRQATHKEVHLLTCSDSDFDAAMAEGLALAQHNAAARLAAHPLRKVMPAKTWPQHKNRLRDTMQAIIQNAHDTGADDFQVEPTGDQVDIRFLYGSLWEVMPPLEKANLDAVVNAFKDAAGVSSVQGLPFQGGKARFEVGSGKTIDVRLEFAESMHGTAISGRLLDAAKQESKAKLPFVGQDLEIVLNTIKQKQGLLLVVGPTGSGKTTTLYGIINKIDKSALNVRTVEDPPEYSMRHVIQFEVGEQVSRTFPQGLKSLLRQKPNVIMLGEIRDAQVGNIAAEAALTGHLVVATLHAIDGPAAVSRLLEMEIEASVLQSTLQVVIGQRLVDLLCSNCSVTEQPSKLICQHFEMHGMTPPGEVRRRGGCPACNNRGIVGRTPIYEVFHPDDELKAMMTHEISAGQLRDKWVKKGGISLVVNGLKLVAAGKVEWEDIRGYDPDSIKLTGDHAPV